MGPHSIKNKERVDLWVSLSIVPRARQSKIGCVMVDSFHLMAQLVTLWVRRQGQQTAENELDVTVHLTAVH